MASLSVMWRTLTAIALVAALASCSDPPSAPAAPARSPPASASPAPAPSGLPPVAAIAEVRVLLMWDEATQTVHRRMGDVEYANDADLEKAVRDAHDVWVKKGKPDVPVTIDGDVRIPWADVIDVVNIVKRCGIEHIEFAMGAPPKRPPGRK